uniref:Elicitor-responsive protein 3 n=1 Tax=Tanacetum cinerariifolium TaxID=118510 RepID=A0A6L2NWQ9_TANCI|nr:elicitor-responsive protein 3 [Tanacetum cinerariifolium]
MEMRGPLFKRNFGRVQMAKVLSSGYDDSSWPLQTKSGRRAGEVRLIIHYSNANNTSNSYAPSAPLYGPVTAPYSSMYSTPQPASLAQYPPAFSGAYSVPSPYSRTPNSSTCIPSPYPPNAGVYPPSPYPPQAETYPPQPYGSNYAHEHASYNLMEVVTVVCETSNLIWARHMQIWFDILEGSSCLQNNMNAKLSVIHRDIKSATVIAARPPPAHCRPAGSFSFSLHAGEVRLIMHYSTANNQETPYEPLAPLYGSSSATQYPQGHGFDLFPRVL